MEKQKCKQCKKTFDFDKGGFGSDFGGYVCSEKCAKMSAKESGRHFAIHDKEDNIVDKDY